MNIKKIIPLSLATLSVMGAFTACSDNKVVGADEQSNTVAGFILSSDVQRVMQARLKEVAKPNVPTSALLAHDSTLQLTVVETFDGDEIYNNEKNRMINTNYIDTTITETKGWKYYSMQDENGVLHGPIAMAQVILGFGRADLVGHVNNVACVNENKWLRDGDVVHRSSDSYQFERETFQVSYGSQFQSPVKTIQVRQLHTRDSLMLAQFIEDCAALDGKLGKDESVSFYGGVEAEVNPRLICTSENDDYYDPYWEKYALFIVNNCRSDIESSDHIPVVQWSEEIQ